LAISYFSKPKPYYEQLIRIQTEQELGHLDSGIINESLDIQTLLLDYSGDQALLLKAWIALKKYPEQSRKVFQLYGTEPEFKEILRNYGEPVIPVIKYFLDNDVLSIKIRNVVTNALDKAKQVAHNAWERLRGKGPTNSNPVAQKQQWNPGPEERGWYAVNFIKNDGYSFLGQFEVDADNTAKWNQTNRVTDGLTSFLTGGVSNLERKYDLHDEITITDVFFAGVDVVPFVASLKLLKAGKLAASSGKELSLVSRTRVFASRLIPKSELFQKLEKYGAVAATAYIVVTHPGLINSVLAEVAALMGLNPLLFQFAVWFLIVAVALYPFLWLLKAAARFILFSLSWIEWSRKKRAQGSPPMPPAMAAV
jgi:hypothetical protein